MAADERRLALIVNPSAGGGRAGQALPDVQDALRKLGLEHRVETTRSLEHAGELAREAAGREEVAVAFGGDGLLSAVAGALARSNGVVGVLPGGRGNDFARVLGIPLEPVPACSVLATGIVKSLDLGEANGRMPTARPEHWRAGTRRRLSWRSMVAASNW
jgi:diacylglycerol kinase family enzyme